MAKRERKPKAERVRKPKVPKEPKEKKFKRAPSEKSSGNDYDKLFDFIKVFFGNNPKYKETNDYQKKKHRFMMQRFMSIRYPDTAQRFNINKINPVAVVNLWRMVATKYNRTPLWVFTKTKKAPEVKENNFVPSEDTVNFYLKYHSISKRDLNDAMKFNKDVILNELELIEKTRKDD